MKDLFRDGVCLFVSSGNFLSSLHADSEPVLMRWKGTGSIFGKHTGPVVRLVEVQCDPVLFIREIGIKLPSRAVGLTAIRLVAKHDKEFVFGSLLKSFY